MPNNFSRSLCAVSMLLFLHLSIAQENAFRWPTLASITRINYGFDNDPDNNEVLDFQCGSNAYDGHRGHDIGTRRNDDVIAGATGWVQRRADGFGDGYIGSNDGNGFGNHVVLYHDGYNSIYAHFNAGTVVPQLNDTVACGTVIGGSGTSGNSSGVHLHFEVRLNVRENNYYSGSAVDPFMGDCSTPVSYWVDQREDQPSVVCADAVPITPSFNKTNKGSLPARLIPEAGGSFSIQYHIPETTPANSQVSIRIFNIEGKVVWNLPPTTKRPGQYEEKGGTLPSGIYFLHTIIDAQNQPIPYFQKWILTH